MIALDCAYSNHPISYDVAMDIMDNIVHEIITQNRTNTIWFLEHHPVYTAGLNALPLDLIAPVFPVYKTDRGGKYTYHGPGQRVVYIMVDLKQIYHTPDIRDFIVRLESAVIDTLMAFEVQASTQEGMIGIWATHMGQQRKLAAIGMRVKKWVTYHGIAINIAPNLSHYSGIIPCGIHDTPMTSLEEMGCYVPMKQFDDAFIQRFQKAFEFEISSKYEIKGSCS
ncbi:lipoyl(octanoyl) transferase LipB [Rickettsiales endosymbiont of Peranema trichophorum]|nr:lipoyl(octanoyl) transferase LipB [Rickettsiales endosymbiont of Peranema trichophorum]